MMGLTNGCGVSVKLIDNSSNRLRPRMKYAIGPLKFLINVLLFCTIAGFAYVSASDVQVCWLIAEISVVINHLSRLIFCIL